jgi:hypothetical protein
MPHISERLEKVLADVCPTEYNGDDTFFVGPSPEQQPLYIRKEDSAVSLFDSPYEPEDLKVTSFKM